MQPVTGGAGLVFKPLDHRQVIRPDNQQFGGGGFIRLEGDGQMPAVYRADPAAARFPEPFAGFQVGEGDFRGIIRRVGAFGFMIPANKDVAGEKEDVTKAVIADLAPFRVKNGCFIGTVFQLSACCVVPGGRGRQGII